MNGTMPTWYVDGHGTMPTWYVDGHCIAANAPESARQEVRRTYSHDAEVVRPWTAEDQEDLENAS